MWRDRQEPMVAGHVAQALVGRLAEHGLDVQQLLRRRHIPLSHLAEVRGQIPLRSYVGILEDAAEISGEPLLCLSMSQGAGPEALGAVGFLFLSAPSLRDALDLLCRYSEAIQDRTRMRLEVDERLAKIIYQISDDLIAPRRQDAEFSLGLMIRLMKTYLGQSGCASEVHLEHAPGAATSAYEQVFGCPIYFNQPTNAILLPREMLNRGGRHPQAWLHPILEAQLHDLIDRKRTGVRFRDRILDALEPTALHRGATARSVAYDLGLSASTLHRRLRAEGTSFQRLLDQRREELARRLLQAPGSAIGEVAGALGYAEHAVFTRAFRRWTGLSPTAFRRGSEMPPSRPHAASM
ncbi:MAG: AraC family transcriptional regulator [Phenylobacterium sp.]|uniref:AraC-like transcriptional regulator QhpR n=1 Tax=Phenylobacterium sp. TaxID=1871053 RepID=UPI002734AEE4|nr:AraC family transcriptional regulator [Phenylobacterium sp.]MDP3749534.1 AraC family transcriptional regulator [Phenylobacterium sp.]